jgi:hypothetical protein
MMNVNRDKVFNALITFIIEEIPWAKKKNLNEQIDIINDLGLYGDDCIEFLEKFCQKFHLKCSKLDFSKCGQEGIDPVTGMLLWLLSIFKLKKTELKNGYKISELMECIINEEKEVKG